MENGIEIHEKKDGDREESLWYYGKHIATVIKDGKKFFIEATGEQSVSFGEDAEESLEGDFASRSKET